MKTILISLVLAIMAVLGVMGYAQAPAADLVPVTAGNFIRAESDLYFGAVIKDGGFGKFMHKREATPIDDQTVIKLDTLDGDPNEFASGRGTSQFMNANFIFNPALALRLPYSTLAAGIVWMPIPPSSKGGITVSSTVMNTQDSSTTTGFDDFDEGTSWSTEADFQ